MSKRIEVTLEPNEDGRFTAEVVEDGEYADSGKVLARFDEKTARSAFESAELWYRIYGEGE